MKQWQISKRTGYGYLPSQSALDRSGDVPFRRGIVAVQPLEYLCQSQDVYVHVCICPDYHRGGVGIAPRSAHRTGKHGMAQPARIHAMGLIGRSTRDRRSVRVHVLAICRHLSRQMTDRATCVHALLAAPLARSLVKGFGSSDCRCHSHLIHVATDDITAWLTRTLRKNILSPKFPHSLVRIE